MWNNVVLAVEYTEQCSFFPPKSFTHIGRPYDLSSICIFCTIHIRSVYVSSAPSRIESTEMIVLEINAFLAA